MWQPLWHMKKVLGKMITKTSLVECSSHSWHAGFSRLIQVLLHTTGIRIHVIQRDRDALPKTFVANRRVSDAKFCMKEAKAPHQKAHFMAWCKKNYLHFCFCVSFGLRFCCENSECAVAHLDFIKDAQTPLLVSRNLNLRGDMKILST